MKVGDLIVYRNPIPARQYLERPAIVVAQRVSHIEGAKNFRIYYPCHDEWLNCWEDEFEVISVNRKAG